MEKINTSNKIAIFKGKKIRKTLHNDEWWFSVIDIIEVLTESSNARDYWYKMKIRVKSNDGFELSTNCRQFKLLASDGKKRATDCANTETVFRIIQSIPSPKAEPFKKWLAKVGYERIQEIEDPEIASKRMREIYQAKGYSDAWIEKRMRGIAVRDELTWEWDKRGIKEQRDYSILTAEISKATFGMTPSKYKEYKGLQRENLRDHMTDLELIFTMLGEASTAKIARNKDAQGFVENKIAAKEGGQVAGNARKELEGKIGEDIVTKDNYLEEPEEKKRLKNGK